MGGFFAVASKENCVLDLFFGTDYHSHLGTRRGGIAAFNKQLGIQREIHNIENTPFRTKFDGVFNEMSGNSAIGCISDSDPQPLLIRSSIGTYAIVTVGAINNAEELIEKYVISSGGHFAVMSGGKVNMTELAAALINQKQSFCEGIAFANEVIEGSLTTLILKDNGNIIAARDRQGRLPVLIGKRDDGFCVSFESFAYKKLGYDDEKELGPGEIVEITAEGVSQLKAPGNEMKICAVLWTYYGYPTSNYEGINVEAMRYRNGEILAENDRKGGGVPSLDYVGGVPDSGTPHAIGYANESGVRFARPFIKYTPTWPRSFMPTHQSDRNKIAKMKQIPIHELIEDKSLLFVDDSIVRGTQLKETVDFLYSNGAKAVHMRSACPPIMYGCKYLNFSRSTSEMELIARRVMAELEGENGSKYINEYSSSETDRGKALRKCICEKFNFASLEFQSLGGVVEAIGIDKCKLCTYCWDGRE